ncbi:LptA/OstA family protein [Sphingosinicella sp. BN140058]|uniref:LptA/OstA family protein n=1 Tax=Sphingosinicella sp. BN140058 TaxID=1892855 RepID=UPI001013679E|nr:LptA/OstA family protein [Sphingosinicella sp. BN140058]QAY76651.1 OstA family protein [Sphingosinicella sp. BN140058]
MKTFLLAFGATAAALIAAVPAISQSSALKGHNSNAPVDVAADRIEVQDRADRAVFSGNVVVKQAELTLTAPRLTVAYSNSGGIEIERIDGSGGVTVRSPSETASGQFAIYDINSRLITLIGNVHLVRGDSNVSGGRLVINLRDGTAVMDGGAPAGVKSQGGRVTGTFTVPQRRD